MGGGPERSSCIMDEAERRGFRWNFVCSCVLCGEFVHSVSAHATEPTEATSTQRKSEKKKDKKKGKKEKNDIRYRYCSKPESLDC